MTSFVDLLSALRQRLGIVIGIGAAVFVLMMVFALQLPREYTATSSILIDLAQTDPSGRDKAADANVSVIDSIIGTQMDILRSTVVLDQVLKSVPGFAANYHRGTPERNREDALRTMREHLGISTEKGSNVIRLSFTDRSTTVATEVLQQLVRAYLAKQVELKTGPARLGARWFDQRTGDARQRLEGSLQRLSAFQRQHGILGTERMDVEADRIKLLETQLVEAQAAAAEARSRAVSGTMPEVVTSDVSQNVERDVSTQAGRVAELSRTLGPNHPEMIAARAQLDALRRSLSTARGTQTRSLGSASAAATQREASIRATLLAEQGKLLSRSAVQDQIDVLQRDVDAARQYYDSVRKQANEANLSSQVSQANASLLDPPRKPTLPSKPNLTLWLAASIVLSSVIAVLSGVALEVLSPRLRTPAGAAKALEIDVIADMTGPEPTSSSWRAPSREEAMA